MTKLVVLKESKPTEKRVAITPKVAKSLIENDISISVESGAGILAGFPDEAYRQVGVDVEQDKSRLYNNMTLLAWVKPPHKSKLSLNRLPKNTTLIGFMDPFRSDSIFQDIKRLKIPYFCFELLPPEYKHSTFDALSVMSRFAGRIAFHEAVTLSKNPIAFNQSQIALIIGSGQAGMAAAFEAYRLNYKVIMMSTKNSHKDKRFIKKWLHLPKKALHLQRFLIHSAIRKYHPNIIITTAHSRGNPAPLLIPYSTLNLLEPDSVIMDLTASAGGNTVATQWNKRVRTSNNVLICNKHNYPSSEPHKASIEYAKCVAQVIENKEDLLIRPNAQRYDEEESEKNIIAV